MERKTCLLSFSGGLDSLAAACKLRDDGYDVTLGHLVWILEGSDFGEAQSGAAYRLAAELGMDIETLAHVRMPAASFAKYAWVPIAIATIMHHAGDPCVYPAENEMRFDSVAFGTDLKHDPECDNSIRWMWVAAMRLYIYGGEVLYPLDGINTRSERAALVPDHLQGVWVSCSEGERGLVPCGKCWKCLSL